MSTTQPWLRAELIAGPETARGAQLMIPADGVEFHDDQLVFHHQGEVVYVADQGQLRSITWFAKQPNPETARRKAIWPNHGTRWTDEQRADLFRRLQLGQPWPTISAAAGRSRTGCQQEAVKQGWLDPETLRPRPVLFAKDAPAALPEPDASTEAASTEPVSTEAASTEAATTGHSEEPSIVAAPAEPDAGAWSSPATGPADPAPPGDPSPSEALAALLQGTGPAASLYVSSANEPTPPPRPGKPSDADGPRPRIPRQRTESDPLPEPGDDGSGPAHRFLGRTQSSPASPASAAPPASPTRAEPG